VYAVNLLSRPSTRIAKATVYWMAVEVMVANALALNAEEGTGAFLARRTATWGHS